jgi:hypothetical protein
LVNSLADSSKTHVNERKYPYEFQATEKLPIYPPQIMNPESHNSFNNALFSLIMLPVRHPPNPNRPIITNNTGNTIMLSSLYRFSLSCSLTSLSL